MTTRDPKVLSTLLIALFMQFNVLMAQEFYYPGSGASQFVGENIYFEWNSQDADRYHGFYWNENYRSNNEWKNGYYLKKDVEGTCGDGTGVFGGNYEGPCPCYNNITEGVSYKTNYAAVYYERAKYPFVCSGTVYGWGDHREFKVKIPMFPLPLIDGTQVFSCPDGTVELTADIRSDVFYNERPTEVTWTMVDVSNPANPVRTRIYTSTDHYWNTKSKLRYKFSPTFAGLIEVQSKRNYSGCEITSPKAIITVVPGVTLPLLPPEPILETSCSGENKNITVPNPHNYDGVYWYDNYLSATPIWDGFTYQVQVKSGLNELYVEYYKRVGTGSEGCEIKSPRSTVYLYSPPKLYPAKLEQTTIYDYRHFDDADCDAERDAVEEQQYPYHTDLLDPLFTNQLTDAILSKIQPPASTCLQLDNLQVNQRWEVVYETESGLEPYAATTDNLNQRVLRVCANNLSSDENILGSKEYALKTNAKMEMHYCDRTGVLKYGRTLTCDLAGSIRRVSVRTVKPGRVTNGICVFPVGDLPEKYIEENNLSCDRRQNVTICAKEEKTIGPEAEEVANFFFGATLRPPGWETMFKYEWTGTTDGLSSTTIRNPKVRYNDMGIPDYNMKAYHLKITYTGAAPIVPNPGPMHYCSFVYKCGECSVVLNPDPLNFSE